MRRICSRIWEAEAYRFLGSICVARATILSASMMLRYSLGEEEAASAIDQAVENVLKKYRTPDLVTQNEQIEQVGCSRMGDLVASAL